MEVLLVKFGILAGLFGIIGLAGLVILLVSVIWLVIRIANFDSVIPALLLILISIGLIAAGLVLSPVPDISAEAVKTAQGNGSDDGSSKNPETDVQVENQDGVPEEGASQMSFTTGGQTENGAAGKSFIVSNSGQTGMYVEGTLQGWRVGLTLPDEWDDICVIEKSSSSMSFCQQASRNIGGFLFDLSVVEGHVDPDAPDAWPAFDTVSEKEGMSLIAMYPTDVQFDMQFMDEYNRMSEAIPGILETVQFERVDSQNT